MSIKALCTITLDCNNNCLCCFIPAHVRHQSTILSRDYLLEQLCLLNLGESDLVVFSGGEPTTHPKLIEILQEIKPLTGHGRYVLIS